MNEEILNIAAEHYFSNIINPNRQSKEDNFKAGATSYAAKEYWFAQFELEQLKKAAIDKCNEALELTQNIGNFGKPHEPQSQQKQSGYRVVSKDEWFAMRTDERHQLVAGRDLKTGEAIWLAENKPEPQKQSAVWVSVRDKLPDDSHGRVLVYVREVDDLGISYFVWNCSYSKAHGFTDKRQHYDVTHWMPLPEPPKTPPHENL